MRETVSKMKGHGIRARPKVDKHDTSSLLTPFPDTHIKQEMTLIERTQHLTYGWREAVRGQQRWMDVGFRGGSDYRALEAG